MPEIKRPVQTVEVNYLCDACGHGMMQKAAEMDSSTGEILHRCMICAAEKTFKWVTYPRIDYVALGDKV